MKDVCTINEDLLHLMDKPDFIATNACPICNARGPLEAHHVVKRSQGEWVENGKRHRKPIITLCHRCHIERVHSEQRLWFDYTDEGWMYLLLTRVRARDELEKHPEWGGRIGYQNAKQIEGWRYLLNDR